MDITKMKFDNIIFHDTETTGADAEDRIIESAHIYFDGKGKCSYREDLNKAPLPIKPAAAMTHGYTNKMIADCQPFETTESCSFLNKHSNNKKTYYVAHNAPFDIGMLEKEGIYWNPDFIIDTLRVSQHLYQNTPEVEMFKLQYFRYLYEFDDQPWFQDAMAMFGLTEIKPHTALSDIFILWLFYAKMRNDFNLTNEDMVRLSQTPVEESVIKFGNVFEKGVDTYENICISTYTQYGREKNGYEYLDWAVNNMDLSADREFSIKKVLAQGVLTGFIPVTKYKSHLYWGVLFSFNDGEISAALEMLNQDNTFRKFIYDSSLGKFEQFKAEFPESPTNQEAEEMKKRTFLNNFIKKYRKDFLI